MFGLCKTSEKWSFVEWWFCTYCDTVSFWTFCSLIKGVSRRPSACLCSLISKFSVVILWSIRPSKAVNLKWWPKPLASFVHLRMTQSKLFVSLDAWFVHAVNKFRFCGNFWSTIQSQLMLLLHWLNLRAHIWRGSARSVNLPCPQPCSHLSAPTKKSTRPQKMSHWWEKHMKSNCKRFWEDLGITIDLF